MAATAELVEPRGKAGALLALGAVGLLAVCTLLALATASPWVALCVPLAAAAAWALYALPLRVSALGLLGLVLACEGLQYALGPNDAWHVPLLNSVASWLFYNLSAMTGASPLRAPLIDMLTVALLLVSLARAPRHEWSSSEPTVRAMHMALWASALCAAVLMVIGVAGGGNFDESLWQTRHILLFPVRAVLLMRALDFEPGELRLIGRLLVACAVLKAAIGLWVLYVVAPATGVVPEFTTSHTDTLLFVPVLAMFFARAIEAKSGRALLAVALWAPIVVWGLAANDRRVSYVSLTVGCVVMLVMSPPTPVKRALATTLAVLAPLFPFYAAAGWSSDGTGWFAPVGVLKSLVSGEHRFGQVVDYRDLENVNLLATWSHHKVLPMGFGNQFELLMPLPDISSWFASWQYHPHNSFLWFFASGGPIGFTVMMMPLLVTLYLAARAYRASVDTTERVALLTCIATAIAYFNQMWGDMGTLSWTVSWMAALAAAVAAKLALKTGAWPKMFRVRVG